MAQVDTLTLKSGSVDSSVQAASAPRTEDAAAQGVDVSETGTQAAQSELSGDDSSGGGSSGAGSSGGLAEIIEAYNLVTQKLQVSHERLQGEVTRLRRELASADAQIQRQKRLAALGEMAAGIAHEIRNPLGAIQLYAEMVHEDLVAADDTPARDNAVRIIDAVRGLNAIVGDVLTFAKQVQTRPTWVQVQAVWGKALDAARAEIEALGVDVVVQAIGAKGASDGPRDTSELWADVGMLNQALVNLVRNAAEAMADASTRTLTLTSDVQTAGVLLSIADTGGGIEDDDIDRIFNPFFTTRSTGTGLGLAIVHRIIDAHGGTVTALNDQAADASVRGAVFRVFLPFPESSPPNPPEDA